MKNMSLFLILIFALVLTVSAASASCFKITTHFQTQYSKSTCPGPSCNQILGHSSGQSTVSCNSCSGRGSCGNNGRYTGHNKWRNNHHPWNNNTCSGGNCTNDTSNGTVPPIIPGNSSGLTTVQIKINGVYELGGNHKILTTVENSSAVDPTYQQLMDFLQADKTDEKPYTNSYVCSDFAAALHSSAETAGIQCAWVAVPSCNHAFNEFMTTDRGIVYIDDTGVPRGSKLGDKELNVVIGQPLTGKYLFKNGTVNMGCNVRSILVFW